MPNKFCAICGKNIDDTAPHFGMCFQCYLIENPLFELPDAFSFKICLDCGSYSKREEWFEPKKTELLSVIEESIKYFLLNSYKKKRNIDFTLSFTEESFVYSSRNLLKALEVTVIGCLKKDIKIYHQQTIKINLIFDLCKNCSNLRGGFYYLSCIQLRVKNETQFTLITEVLEKIQSFVEMRFEKDQKQYISGIEDQKYGVDLLLSTNELMNRIISFLRGKYHFLLKRSKKLAGRDNQRGKSLYRLTALIKFLPMGKNDIILIDKDKKFFIKKIFKNKVVLITEQGTKLIKNYSYFFNENVKIEGD